MDHSRATHQVPRYSPANFHRALVLTQASWGYRSYLSNLLSTVEQESVSSFEDDDDDNSFLPAPRRVRRRPVNNSFTILPVFDKASEYSGDDVELENNNAKKNCSGMAVAGTLA